MNGSNRQKVDEVKIFRLEGAVAEVVRYEDDDMSVDKLVVVVAVTAAFGVNGRRLLYRTTTELVEIALQSRVRALAVNAKLNRTQTQSRCACCSDHSHHYQDCR